MGLRIKSTRQFGHKIATLMAVFALVAQPMYGFVAQELASAAPNEVVKITSLAELRDAINNQGDGQTWNIYTNPTGYGLTPNETISVGGQTGWYLPITADNLTVNGVGNPVLWGDGFSRNASWSKQNFVAVFGDNVTLKNLTLMNKIEPNKVVEVVGDNSTIENVSIQKNTKVNQSVYDEEMRSVTNEEARQWSGAIYYNDESTHIPAAQTKHTLRNVTINNGGVSVRATSNATLTFDNLHLIYRSNIDWINGYRVYNPNNATIDGSPQYTYQVSHPLGNLESVLKNVAHHDSVQGVENIKLISDLYLNKQVTITKPGVTIDGAKAAGGSYTMFGNFAKTSFSNNAALGIQADNVTVGNLNINGASGTDLHGINVYEAKNVNLNNVILKDNSYAGMIVGKDSEVTVSNITTTGNNWYGINVDKASGTSATLTVNGSSTHDEDSTAHIYIDDRLAGGNVVNDTAKQYIRNHAGDGYQYLLDREAPKISLSASSDYNPESFTVNATDDQGVATIGYSLWKGGERIGVWGQGAIPWNERQDFKDVKYTYKSSETDTYLPLKDLVEPGVYTIHATATDARGKSTNAVGAKFTVDKEGPEISEVSINEEIVPGSSYAPRNCSLADSPYIVSGTIRLSAVASDATSGMAKVSYRVSDLSSSGCASANGRSYVNVSHPLDTTDLENDTVYRISVVGWDKADNRTPVYVDILVDNSVAEEPTDPEDEPGRPVTPVIPEPGTPAPTPASLVRDQLTGAGEGGSLGAVLTPLNPGIVAVLDQGQATEEEEEGEVLADEDNAQANNTENGEVLADEDAADEGCAKFLGLCWYWWIPIVGAVLVVGWILRGMLREDDELPSRRQ